MEHVCRRRPGVRAKVCLLIALVCALWTGAARAERLELEGSDSELGVVIYPATEPGRHGVTVVLHGMCGEPRNTCSHFASAVTTHDHLICPRASRRCDGGGASWPASGFELRIEAAVERAEAVLGERVDGARGRTLIGYSLGAYRALDIVQQAGGKYPRVMLIGAKIFASQRLLKANGVERLLLSAGAADMTFQHMQKEALRLSRAGVGARFLSLGAVGHFFTPSFQSYLPEALAWLNADDSVS